MGTRCGDIDPAIVGFLMDKEHISSEEVDNILNKNQVYLVCLGYLVTLEILKMQ